MSKDVNNLDKFGPFSRNERVENIYKEGALNERRFILSPNTEVRERIRTLYEIVKEFKIEHPETIAFVMHGSLTKGYAHAEESDIDGFLLVDYDFAFSKLAAEEKLQSKEDSVRLQPPGGTLICQRYRKIFLEKLEQKFGENLKSWQKKDIFAQVVGKNLLKENLSSDDPSDYFDAANLFFLPVGRVTGAADQFDLDSYRKVIFDELESQGQRGNGKWVRIMRMLGARDGLVKGIHELIGPQTNPSRHEKIYPQTIAEARSYFLRKLTKTK